MEMEPFGPDILWQYYQRGYQCLVRNGIYFRQVLRPALSHVYFQKAIPLLTEYAHANQTNADLPPGFRDQMEACPLTTRDLLHLDYAICLGYAEEQALQPMVPPVMDWPGPGGYAGILIAADAPLHAAVSLQEEALEENEDSDNDNDDSGFTPPFDL